jgi:hypothetical protein
MSETNSVERPVGQSLLRPATRPPKPRLRWCRTLWQCSGAGIDAYSKTPADAFKQWQRLLTEAGAKVHRHLMTMNFGGCPFCGSQSCVAGSCRSALPNTEAQGRR